MRILFIPVSAPRGTGEYARARALAVAISQRWPAAEIRFVLSRAAPHAADAPFPALLLPSSATFHPAEVSALIGEFRPDVIVFDNAGRTRQLEAARASGARVVYVSSRPRQRRKAFRLRWMRLIDEHWIAWPAFIAGPLGAVEKLKLRLLSRPRVRYFDAMMPEPGHSAADEDYVLVVPGGGTGHPGAEDGPAIMARAAAAIAARGHRTVLVGSTVPIDGAPVSTLRQLPQIAMDELATLIAHARLVVTNGGDTLLQALSCQRLCVAAAIARDQRLRIERCADEGFVVRAPLDAAGIESAVIGLLDDVERQRVQLARLAARPLHNGLETALESIAALAGVEGTSAAGVPTTASVRAVAAEHDEARAREDV